MPHPPWRFANRIDLFSPPVSLQVSKAAQNMKQWETSNYERLISSLAYSLKVQKKLSIVIVGGSVTCGHMCKTITHICTPLKSQKCFGEQGPLWDLEYYGREKSHLGAFCSWPTRLTSFIKERLPNVTVHYTNLCVGGTAINKARQKYFLWFKDGKDVITGEYVDVVLVDTSLNECISPGKYWKGNRTLLRILHDRFIREITLDSPHPPSIVYVIGGGIRFTDLPRTRSELTCLDLIEDIASSYNLPTVWYKDYYDQFYQQMLDQTLFSIVAKDGHHPSWIGSEFLAQYYMAWFDWLVCSAEKTTPKQSQGVHLPAPKWV